jgi:TolB-like protein/predicted Ser/Thr protein kinase
VTPERWQVVKDALAGALACASTERETYLVALRARDAALAHEVESLLAHDAEDSFLDQPAVASPHSENAAFGSYRLQSSLGEGGMGVVYLAQDTILERPVALKFLSHALEQQDDARRRFLREAKAAAALDHPYICKIYQTGELEGRPFIAMEYVRGETLRHRLDTAPLPLRDVLWIALEVTEALETAHAALIVHRDLKPSNIMLTADGHVKVLDFGLAKRVGPEAAEYAKTRSELTETGTVQGTVAYMSPEQVRGQEVDFRSDLFSLGVVLYECLAGRNPFVAGSSLETASQILHHVPPPLRLTHTQLPAALDEIVRRLLAKTVDQRYDSAVDLRRDLVRVRDLVERGQVDVAAPAAGVPGAAAEPLRRVAFSRRAVLSSAAAAALVVAGGVWWIGAQKPASREPMSVAVMPFANVSSDAGNDYLAAGIPREVTKRLGRAGARVIPWETALRFGDTANPVEVARALRVDSVVKGSLQTVGGRLLVNVSLVDGATGFLSWQDELEFEDLFEAQTRIARGVALKLGHELTGETAATLARPESSSGDAYDLYLQGAAHLNDGGKESTDIAFGFFTKALQLDPNLVETHVGLGAVYLERYWSGWGGGAGNLDLAAKAFDDALERDPKDMRARRGKMLIAFYRGRGDEALRLAQEAARVGGGDIETLLARAEAFVLNGPSDLAGPLLERVLALDPGNQAAAWLRTIMFHRTDRFTETAAAAADYTRRFGEDSFVAVLGASALERLGDLAGARERYVHVVERLMQPSIEPGTATAYDLVALLAAGVLDHRTGNRERALELWRRGLQLTRDALAVDADGVGLQVFRATFLGYLGDRAFSKEAAAALASLDAAGLNPWELIYLAGGYAQLGEVKSAIGVLRSVIARGRLPGRAWLTVVAPSLRSTPELNEVLRAHDAEEERRRRRYGAS